MKQHGYTSDFTAFINRFVTEHPEVWKEQYTGWALYWVRHSAFEDLEASVQDSLPIESYYYYPLTRSQAEHRTWAAARARPWCWLSQNKAKKS